MIDKMKQLQKIVVIVVVVLSLIPVSITTAEQPRGKHQVILDAGHGGKDPGVKLTEKYSEKDITLSIALMVKKELDKSGNLDVFLTRSSDVYISASERAKTISKTRPDVFVGIHVNAGYGKESSGYELYFPGFASLMADQVNSQEILADMAKNKYLNDSVRLAQLIQRNLEDVFPRKSRGLRNAPHVILEGLVIPAVVVEIGFATNQEDKKRLLDENVRGSIARSLSKSIKEYF
jgi:N-acetylmuramoyl-L-alanine amidase